MPNDQTRQCPQCGVIKPLTSEFWYKGTNSGFSGYCKKCVKEKNHKRYHTTTKWKGKKA